MFVLHSVLCPGPLSLPASMCHIWQSHVTPQISFIPLGCNSLSPCPRPHRAHVYLLLQQVRRPLKTVVADASARDLPSSAAAALPPWTKHVSRTSITHAYGMPCMSPISFMNAVMMITAATAPAEMTTPHGPLISNRLPNSPWPSYFELSGSLAHVPLTSNRLPTFPCPPPPPLTHFPPIPSICMSVALVPPLV